MVEAGHKLVVLHVDSVEVLLALRREIGPALTIRVRDGGARARARPGAAAGRLGWDGRQVGAVLIVDTLQTHVAVCSGALALKLVLAGAVVGGAAASVPVASGQPVAEVGSRVLAEALGVQAGFHRKPRDALQNGSALLRS